MPKTKMKPKTRSSKRKAPNGSKPSSAADPAKESSKAEAAELAKLQKIFKEVATPDDAIGLRYVDVDCPHCGEDFEIAVDPQEEGQEMIQDCSVCCKPITFSVEVIDGDVSVSAFS